MSIRRVVYLLSIALAILVAPTIIYGIVYGIVTGDDFSSDGGFAQFLWNTSIICAVVFLVGVAVYYGTKLANQDRE